MNVRDKATYKAGASQYLLQFFRPNAVKIVNTLIAIFEKVSGHISLTHEEVHFPIPFLLDFYPPDHHIAFLRSIPDYARTEHIIAHGVTRPHGTRSQTA